METSVRRKTFNRSKAIRSAMIYSVATGFVLWILFPIWYTLSSSFTKPSKIGIHPTPFWPENPTLNNYRIVLGIPVHGKNCVPGIDIKLCETAQSNVSVNKIVETMLHSFYVGALVVIFTLIISTIAAYSLSRYRFIGSNFFLNFTILSRIVPGLVLVAPIFIFLRVLNLLNTPWALIISYTSFTLPLAIIILKNYFDQISIDLEEAAALDGASRMQTLNLIILPVAVPGLIATGVLVFLESWSEFFFALVLTDSYTVPPLLAGFLSMQTFNWTLLSAATVIAIIPPVLLTMIFQKFIVTALASGTGK
ncbi:MAG: ABC transporter permease subunit [Actinobacteria bacterium]|nr:ABC transporter permease subunit [Actinomycetota bacterium]MSX89175.1 ABC transporter permease subunit [Actinomycetota bacterium]MSZ63725.1 ABC transporter permease subunit [Actinomycetota bacterium]MTA58114.1 ABC transporter permease subunit [Actinomycetota bacterium]